MQLLVLLILTVAAVAATADDSITKNCKFEVEENIKKDASLENSVHNCIDNTGGDLSLLNENYDRIGRVVELFGISDTGHIKLLESPDREDPSLACSNSIECVIKATLRVFKGTELKEQKIAIILKDVNDNEPKFKKSVLYIKVDENTFLSQQLPKISDGDAGENGRTKVTIKSVSEPRYKDYTILSDEEQSKPLLKLSKTFDYEKIEFYQINLTVCDNGSKQLCSLLIVNVNITDLNDNKPKFTRAIYEMGPFKESIAMDTEIGEVHADDKDSGNNGNVTYSISTSTTECKSISVDPQSGLVTLIAKVDAVKNPTLKCSVVAKDGGLTSSLEATATIKVNFTDVNDHAPEVKLLLSVDVPESNKTQNVTALHLRVTDRDSGLNAQFNCSLSVAYTDSFSLLKSGSNIFKIQAIAAFDREMQESAEVTVICWDYGSPQPLTSTSTFSITIKDVNEHRPKFSENIYYGTVSEGEDQMPILSVNATDLDATANVTYTLLNQGTLANLFSIDPNSGLIKTMAALDREAMKGKSSSYSLTAIASDGAFSATCKVEITVTDVNDQVPTVSGRTLFVVNETYGEEGVSEKKVGKLEYTDKDKPRTNNSLADFDLIKQQPITHVKIVQFTVKPDGEILASGKLDRESQQQHLLIVRVTDRGSPSRSSSATVTVSLRNVNDNPPIIESPVHNQMVNVTADHTPGVSAFEVEVADHDSCWTSLQLTSRDCFKNGQFTLRLQQRITMFSVSRNTGEIKVVNALSPGSHRINLSVTDSGWPRPLTTTVSFTVIVLPMRGDNFLFGARWSSASNWTVLLIIIITSSFITVILVVAIVMLNKSQPCCYGYSDRRGYRGPKDQYCVDADAAAMAAATLQHEARRISSGNFSPLTTFGQSVCFTDDSFRRQQNGNGKDSCYSFAPPPCSATAAAAAAAAAAGGGGCLLLPGDYEVASADSGHGASEEEMHQDLRYAGEHMRCMTLPNCHPLLLKQRPAAAAAPGGCNCIVEEDSFHQNQEQQPLTLLSDPQFGAVSIPTSAAGYMSLSRQPHHSASPVISSRCITPQHFYGALSNGNKQQQQQQHV